MANAQIDQNSRPALTAVSSVDKITIVPLYADPITHRLLVSSTLVGYTVATLPTGVIGKRAYVTDATTPTYLGALVGGGAVTVPVFFNGTMWISA